MRYFAVFSTMVFIIVSNNNTNAQAVVGYPALDRIYSGYPNYFECASTVGDTSLNLTATNASVKKSGNGFIITPSGTKDVTISIYNSNKELLASKSYRVLTIPNPDLYLGNTKNGNKLYYRLSNELKIQIDPYTTLGIIEFSIETWEVNISSTDKTYKGTGNILSDEAVEQIRIAPDNSEISISCTYRKRDENNLKVISGKFKL